MKAWVVRDAEYWDSGCRVVFAPNAAKARRAGMDAFDYPVAFVDVRAKRFPAADGREADPPTLEELVRDMGWWTMCHQCDRVVDGQVTTTTSDERVPVGTFSGVFVTCAECAGVDATSAEASA